MINDAYKKIFNVTYDNKKYEFETEELLFRTFFFLSDQEVFHTRSLYNLVDLASELGGLSAVLLSVFGAIGNYINI